jgi:hypothetical protein
MRPPADHRDTHGRREKAAHRPLQALRSGYSEQTGAALGELRAAIARVADESRGTRR